MANGLCFCQVTHQETGEVMVLKELLRFDEDTHKMFLKEVSDKEEEVDFVVSWISQAQHWTSGVDFRCVGLCANVV